MPNFDRWRRPSPHHRWSPQGWLLTTRLTGSGFDIEDDPALALSQRWISFPRYLWLTLFKRP